MYSKPRPAPSPAALKVLYQLAYISTGTAVGIATVCAEERRRRIQIVQRIADNARAIRQSPRYYHNVALASSAGDGSEHAFWGGGWTPEGESRRRRKRKVDVHDSNDGAVKGPELPSVVDKEYTHTVRSDHGKLRWRPVKLAEPPITSASVKESARQSEITFADVPSGQLLSPVSYSGPAPIRALYPQHPEERDRNAESFTYRVFRKAPNGKFIARKASEQSQLMKSTTTADDLDSAFITRTVWHRPVETALETGSRHFKSNAFNVSTEDITHDVDLFFHATNSRFCSGTQHHRMKYFSDQLLQLAIQKGSLDDLRSLCLWKRSNKAFRDAHVRDVCSACNDLASRIDHPELLDFFTNFLASDYLRWPDSTFRVAQGFTVLSNAFGWDLGASSNRLLRHLCKTILQTTDPDDVIQSIHAKCGTLLSEGRVSSAAKLFLTVTKLVTKNVDERRRVESVGDKIFTSALNDGQLSTAGRILRWELRYQPIQSLRHSCMSFIKACDEQQAHVLLTSLVFPKIQGQLRTLVHQVDSQSREILAIVCSKDDSLSAAFQAIYRTLPESSRMAIDATRMPMTLYATWKATHNLDLVRTQLTLLADRLQQDGEYGASRKLDLTMLDILIDANRTDEAFTTLARINKLRGAKQDHIIRAAVLFAQKRAWEPLGRLLEIAKNSSSFQFHKSSTYTFNNVIRLYSQQHSAADTWKFVTAAIDTLGFQPTRNTTEVLLQCFVSKNTLELIPAWLRFLKILGHRFELDAKAAAKLLTRYYLDNRPNHILVMWFCRNLMHFAPSLAVEEFVGLVKEAIGYDVKKMSGQHAHWQRTHAHTRLERLEDVRGCMPSPGFRYDQKLHFVHPDACSEGSEPPKELQRTRLTPKFTELEPPSAFSPTQREAFPTSVSELENLGSVRTVGNYSIDRHDDELRNYQLVAALNHEEDQGGAIPVNPSSMQPSALTETEAESGTRFQDLRPEYHDILLVEDAESPFEGSDQSMLERNMILALSLAQYSKVIDLYNKSLDAVGLPSSPRSLEIAVEATLRLRNGDSLYAEQIMSSAREAGMNVTCAMGPLLIHQMQRLDTRSRREANNIRTTVIEYYRMNNENGWPVSHRVGVTAADVLIRNRRSEYGLNILSAIYKSEWATARPFDIIAMTVFLKGYLATQSVAGIRWVVRTVLEEDIRIDEKFMRLVNQLPRERFFLARDVSRRNGRHLKTIKADLLSWIAQCRKRRARQMLETKSLGKKLVACIARCTREEPTIDIDERQALEEEIFGKNFRPWELNDADRDGDAASDDALASPAASAALEESKKRLDIRSSPRLASSRLRARKAMGDIEWLRKYRFFLRKPVVTSDGKSTSFRYQMPGDPGGWEREARMHFFMKRKRNLISRPLDSARQQVERGEAVM